MRPYLLRTGLTMLIVSALALSCREEQGEVATARSPESPYRKTIEDYFSRLKPEEDAETVGLSEVKNAIDLMNVDRHPITSNEDILIADVRKFGFHDEATLKALFFIQQGEIVRSSLVAFSNTSADHNKLILAIATRRFNPYKYNGRITFYTPYRTIMFFNEIDHGRLTSNGIVQSRKNSKGNSAGRTEGCIDWFLITTYHYASGGTSTSEAYLTTTCGGDCQTWRMQGRTNCDGGVAGGSTTGSYGPSLPTDPLDGDRYVFTDPDGKVTTYLYSESSRAWTVYLIVLPEFTVQSYPATYSYLASDGPPADNTSLTGPDGLLYIYDAWSASWEVGQNFFYGGGLPESIIRNRSNYFRCFNTTSPATLTIYVDQPKAGSTAPVNGTDVGHSWLSLTQTGPGGPVTRVFGYYPEDGAGPMDPTDAGVLVNDSGHGYDVSVTVPIPGVALAMMIDYLVNRLPATYDLSSFNCTDLVVDACNAARVRLPETPGSWLGGGGLCPGQLGEDLRTYDIPGKAETKDTDGGVAPVNSGGC